MFAPSSHRTSCRSRTMNRVLRAVALAALSFGAFTVMAGHAVGQTPAYQVYQYDSLGNLILSWGNDGNRAEFSYDPADNRTSAAVVQGAAPPAPEPPVPPPAPRYQVLPRPGGPAVVVPYRD